MLFGGMFRKDIGKMCKRVFGRMLGGMFKRKLWDMYVRVFESFGNYSRERH